MKFWHPLLGFIITKVIAILNDNLLFPSNAWGVIYDLTSFFYAVFLFMFIYAVIRNIIRAIKAQASKKTSSHTNAANTKPERTAVGVRDTGAGSSADYERWRAEQLHNQGKEP